MLEELYVNNLVIFEQASLPLTPGLNVVSGETGAGKSLVTGAISLALGSRANSDMIRKGFEQATVSAVFSAPREKHLKKISEDVGAPTDEPLIFERRISEGRSSRLALCGRPVSSSNVQPLADALLDIAAQNEHTRLLDQSYQRELLDRFGKISTAAFREKFSKATEILRRLESGDAQREKMRLEIERIEYKLEKISDFGFDPESDPLLEERISLMSNADNIRSAAEEGAQTLYEGDGAVTDQIGAVLREVEAYEDCGGEMAQAAEYLRTALAALEDGARALQQAAGDSDFSPEELDAAINRAEEMKNLVRILECPDEGVEFIQVIPHMETLLNSRLDELASWNIDTAQAEKELDKILVEIITLGAELTAERKKAGEKLAKAVNKELKDLGMPEANFSVELDRLWTETYPPRKILSRCSAAGLEDICFMIAPNPGEAPSTIADTASGGEASRTMLAIKSALAAVHSPPTLLFDEIDAGVGGRLGAVLGKKLQELSKDRQIIVITHLPQIAACADNHLKVTKQIKDGRTVSGVEVLDDNERIEEIAQMIHGEAATETTRKQAKEMFDKARSAE